MSLNVSRRNALAGASVTLAALSVPAQVRADPTLLHVSTVAIFDVAKYYAADAQGYFAAENLAVTTEPVQSGAAGVPALLNGQFDVLYNNVASTISAIDRGFDLRIVMGGSPNGSKPPGQSALMKRRGDPIHNGKDLEGKTVGVNGVRGINWVLTRSWVKLNGGDPDNVSFLELPNSVLIDSIKAKRIDAAYVVDPFMTSGRARPRHRGLRVAAEFGLSRRRERLMGGDQAKHRSAAGRHPRVRARADPGCRLGQRKPRQRQLLQTGFRFHQDRSGDRGEDGAGTRQHLDIRGANPADGEVDAR